MVASTWFGVAFALCLLLIPLLWGAQRLLNTFHPWQDFRRVQRVFLPGPLRFVVLLLVWLGVATVLAALPHSYLLSMQGWAQWVSSSILSWILSVAILLSGVLIAGASSLSAARWRRRRAGSVGRSSRWRTP